jgi:hypothetical protein
MLSGMFSCDQFLTEDPKGRLASQTFFTNKKDLDLVLNSLYSVVSSTQGSNTTNTNFLGGDDVSTHPASNKISLRQHDQYDVPDNNAWMPSMWLGHWRVVKASNFIINNAAKTPDVSETDIRSAIAQAHYWRAFSYFALVQTFGPVPIMLEEEINYEAPLVPIEEIYSMVLEDLKIAEQGVPIQYTVEPYARNGMNIAVSQGAVKASLAYVYMAMAGWPLNKGIEYYQLAAAKAKEVIDGADNGTYYYTLLDEYWKVYSWEYNEKNSEVLLGHRYYQNEWTNWAPLADFLQDMAQGGWNDTNCEIKFWKEFPEGPRKEASFIPKLLLTDGELHDWWYDTDPPSRAVVAPCFAKTVEGAVRGTEFDYTDPTPLMMVGDKMHQVIRLSEVYCWYAEAVGRSGQVNAQAVEVLNRVRNRADGKASNRYSTAMTPEQLAEAAYDEHGWEIGGYYWCGFASRYRDMFRMYRVKDHFEFRKQNPLIEVAPGIFRNEAVPVTGTWDDSKMYCPYPNGDAILNPNLKN